MKSRIRPTTRASVAVGVLILFATATPQLHARDNEFGLLVRHVESYYHAKRSHRFLIGFAGLVIRVWRPYGVKGFRMALFENQDLSAARSDDDLPAAIRAGLRDGWQPLVRAYSRRNAERTVIFARPAGTDIQLLIATVEPGEAVVMQMKLNPDKLSESIDRWSREDRGSHEKDGGEKSNPHRDRDQAPEKTAYLAGQ
jgi:hypothetical protein